MDSNIYFRSFIIFWIIFIYFWNIWLNAIWIPNESFYAEAVREMFESGNFLDIYYNYEPRFNKPPLTYWSIALSVFILGLNEFAIRLPIVLMALGTNFLTYLIAKRLYNPEVGFYAFVIMAVSFQFIINSRYASPEVPLAFFFTLTLYLFLKGYLDRDFKYIFFSYISLGLTILTKGYPYFFVISGIVGLYIFIEKNFNIKEVIKELKFLKIYIGIPVALIVGFSWIVYMHLKFGDYFWQVYNEETIKRAFAEESKFTDIFFYLIVILWGFLPYSLTFYYGFINSLKDIKRFSFIFSWVVVMFIIFTIAKGKIPTYFIQAHPALSIFVAYYLTNSKNDYLFKATLIIPAILITGLNIAVIYLFKLDYIYYLISLFPIIYFIRYKDLKLLPFFSILITFFIFVVSILPKVEKYRPYKEIGQKVLFVDKKIPLIIQNRFFHNLPFYTQRKVLRDFSKEQIIDYYNKNGRILALVEEDTLKELKDVNILWSGYLYNKGSESRFAVFLRNIYKAENGNNEAFTKMYLIER